MFQDGVKKNISSGTAAPETRIHTAFVRLLPRNTFTSGRRLGQSAHPPLTVRGITGEGPTLSDRAAPRVRDPHDRHYFPSLPSQQFQALFDSLFKVLCIFPSRYLFAIGLPHVFSFGWSLPPTLSCNPKQLDSLEAGHNAGGTAARTGLPPSLVPFSNRT